ncbi:MAG: hypothetical protein CM1200mP20_03280 [Pseudomonadota bacterium]|nr:MAG: hypothetical protein CM1200mP20_03280 [Pseudomonadota bacterium]
MMGHSGWPWTSHLETGAVEYIKGSHRWGKRFSGVSFSPEELPGVARALPGSMPTGAYRFACYEMEPGDCTIHHGLTVHGAPGNHSATKRRRAYITRWAGDDVTYNPRPNLQRMLRDPGIASGEPLDCELFPFFGGVSGGLGRRFRASIAGPGTAGNRRPGIQTRHLIGLISKSKHRRSGRFGGVAGLGMTPALSAGPSGS